KPGEWGWLRSGFPRVRLHASTYLLVQQLLLAMDQCSANYPESIIKSSDRVPLDVVGSREANPPECGNRGPRECRFWTIKLNDYHRRNLLWLLNLVGYPCQAGKAVEPFTFANNGDWVGEIALMLSDGAGSCVLNE